MRTFKFIAAILIICMAVISFLLKVYPRYYFVGINKSGVDVAKIAIAKNLGPSECFRIVRFDPFDSPSTSTQENLCIYTYAELTKDPSACELLMPSRYGLDCVGVAMDFRRPCALGNDRSVSGNGIDATLQECVTGPDSLKNNSCCLVSKARFITTFNDCSGVTGSQDMKDECQYNLAFKNHDSSYCASIAHENLRAACEVESKALKENPSICDGCVAPVSNPIP